MAISSLKKSLPPLLTAAAALVLMAVAPPTCPGKELHGPGSPVHIELVLLPVNFAEQRMVASVSDGEAVLSFQPANAAVYVAIERHAHDGAAGASQTPDQPIAVLRDFENLVLFIKSLPSGSTVDIGGSCLGPSVASGADPLARPGAYEELRERAAAAGVHLTLHRAG